MGLNLGRASIYNPEVKGNRTLGLGFPAWRLPPLRETTPKSSKSALPRKIRVENRKRRINLPSQNIEMSDFIFALENANWPAILVDGSGRIRMANPAARKAFGS